MKLAIHAGWSGSIKLIRPKGSKYEIRTDRGHSKGTLNADALSVRIIKTKNEPQINHGHCHEQNGQKEEVYKYKGKVYCLEVPSHVFMVRFNNKNVFLGNCSRNGQKGTIGLILPATDMPFTKHGMQPDLIMNPNAFPSRMTFAQFIECIGGKVATLGVHEIDGTPFNDISVEALKDELEKYGFNRNGTEYLYNGMTGEKMKVEVFIGPVSYQRLKHQVADKIHSRARGPRTLLTRQAPEGRSRDGGLRFGEMERDCVIAHGMARFLKERLLECADVYSTFVCHHCGLFARRMKDKVSHATKKDIWYCPACRNHTNVHKIRLPYAFKLLLQELMAMSVAPRIRVKANKFNQ